jgi:hypothetical protein
MSKTLSIKTVHLGYRPPIRMAHFIFFAPRRYVREGLRNTEGMTNLRSKRLFTDTNMHDPALRHEIEDFYHYLQTILRASQLTIPSSNYDLVLDIFPTEGGQIQWSYYYSCHDARCLFWLETYDASHMISGLFGVSSPAHISVSCLLSYTPSLSPLIWCAEHRLESLYW